MFSELRDFLFRGNIVELAVAVIIAGAFGAVVTSLVEDILTPFLGLVGIPDFSTLVVRVGSADLRVGQFLNTVISFALVAVAIFFFVVQPMKRIMAMRKVDEGPAGPTELELLAEIRDELRRRPV